MVRMGEWATTSVAIGRSNTLKMTKEIYFPHSLGLLYSTLTCYTGIRVNSGEYKIMGLAPYGEPKCKQLMLDHLIDVKDDVSFRLNQKYFDYCSGLTMTNSNFDELFGAPPREPEELLTQRHMDLAASVQAVAKKVVLKLTRALANETGQKNLCFAGGVALNCVANGKILRDGAFENVWVQPAGVKFETLTEEKMIDITAQALADGEAIGWFQGRMEFGPRALGGRSFWGMPGPLKCKSS